MCSVLILPAVWVNTNMLMCWKRDIILAKTKNISSFYIYIFFFHFDSVFKDTVSFLVLEMKLTVITLSCIFVFCCRFDCRLVSPCVSASQLMPLCAALWSTSPDVTPPYPPFLSFRVSHGSALGRLSLPVPSALSALRLTLHCVFRPLLQRRLRKQVQQATVLSRLLVLRLLSLLLARTWWEIRSLLYLLHYLTSCGKRQWIMQGFLEFLLYGVDPMTGVSMIYFI